ncbi:MAG: ABC transporter permease subunit [Clostridia bacterium]|nr:ABC transporter permease subunit [Clostridia bacterium]
MKRRVFSGPERVLLGLFAAALLLPFLSLPVWSVFGAWGKNSLLPQNPTLDGFRAFFTRDFGTALRSAVFSLAVSLATLIVAVPAARALLRLRGRAGRLIETILYLPMLMPVVSVSMGIHKLFLRAGLTGTGAVFLMHMYFALPYVFSLIFSCYASWGMAHERAARNLGAGWLAAFFRVHLPIYAPGYRNAFFMGFIISYSQYFVNYYLGGWRDVNFAMILAPLISGSNRNVASVYTLMYLLLGGIVLLMCSVERRKARRTGGGHADD